MKQGVNHEERKKNRFAKGGQGCGEPICLGSGLCVDQYVCEVLRVLNTTNHFAGTFCIEVVFLVHKHHF